MEYPIYIDGRWLTTGKTREIRVPFDSSLFATVHLAGAEEVDKAIESARRTAPLQREMPPFERAGILRRAAEKLAGQKEDFAHAVSSESGKPIRDARLEVDRGIQTLVFSANEAQRLGGEFVPLDAAPAGRGHWAITVREPLGVIAAITPFNFPLNLSLHKIGPAIAAGNTIVHKPASATPVSALMLAGMLEAAGLPAGVLNVVPGPGGAVGRQIVSDPRVAMITFTGSPEVGLGIRNEAGLRRVTLELGSNSAVIVEPGPHIGEAVTRCVTGAFALAGQSCISVQRIFVRETIFEEFLDRFLAATGELRLGHPLQEDTEVSSLIAEAEAVRVETWIQEAIEAGAQLMCGGERRRAVIEPAVLINVPASARLSCQEVFGPVVAVNSYADLDDAIRMVNESEFGLQAGIFTPDIHAAFQAARKIHVGGFWINEIPTYRVDHMPYGGVKLSGTGREGPRYAIEEMTEMKLIGWKL